MNEISKDLLAFPQPAVPQGGFSNHYGYGGMSLYDWFAGMALQGIAMYDATQGTCYTDPNDPQLLNRVRQAFQLAAAAMIVREEKYEN